MAARSEAPTRCTRWCRCRPVFRWRGAPSARQGRATPHTWRRASWRLAMRPSPRGLSPSGRSRPLALSSASTPGPITLARRLGADARAMIDRYALPEMRDVFSERRKLELWLRIELLATEALNAAGLVPDGDWERIRTALQEAA